MPFIIDNFEYFAIGFLVVTIILLFLILRYNIYLSKFFSNKKFRVYSKYQYEPSNQMKSFTLNIFNNNVNDTRIIALGFMYKNHNIDYFKTYKQEHKLPESSKVIIASRDCIINKIDAEKLKIIVSDMNKGKRRVSKIKSYVSDAQGLTFKSNARAVKKQLQFLLNEDYKELQAKKKSLRMKEQLEKRELKRKKRIDNRLRRKEIWNKYVLKTKSVFKHQKSKK